MHVEYKPTDSAPAWWSPPSADVMKLQIKAAVEDYRNKHTTGAA